MTDWWPPEVVNWQFGWYCIVRDIGETVARKTIKNMAKDKMCNCISNKSEHSYINNTENSTDQIQTKSSTK